MASKMKKTQKKQKKNKRDTKLGLLVNVQGVGNGKLDFEHTAPVATSKRSVTRNPSVNGGKSYVVKHSEYLMDIKGTNDYSVTALSIQPGLAKSFPWLSNTAGSFELYKIRNLRYRLETTSPTTSNGSMMLVIDYDPADSLPLNKADFMTKAGATRAAIWDRVMIQASSARRTFSKLYVRGGALSANLDVKTYDYGNVIVGVEGVQAALEGSIISELYVDYEIEFSAPESLSNSEVESASWFGIFSGIAKTTPFLTTPTSVGGGLAITFPTTSTFAISRVGTYLVSFQLAGTVLVANTNPSISSGIGNSLLSTVAPFSSNGIIVAATSSALTLLVKISSAGDSFGLNFTACAGTLSSMSMNVAGYKVDSTSPMPVRFGEQTTIVKHEKVYKPITDSFVMNVEERELSERKVLEIDPAALRACSENEVDNLVDGLEKYFKEAGINLSFRRVDG